MADLADAKNEIVRGAAESRQFVSDVERRIENAQRHRAIDLAVKFDTERFMRWLEDPEHNALPTREDILDDIEDALILAGDPDV